MPTSHRGSSLFIWGERDCESKHITESRSNLAELPPLLHTSTSNTQKLFHEWNKWNLTSSELETLNIVRSRWVLRILLKSEYSQHLQPHSHILTRTCISAFPSEQILISTLQPAHMLFHQASRHLVSASFRVTGWSQMALRMQQAQSQYPNFLGKIALKKKVLLISGKINTKIQLNNSNKTHYKKQ